MNNFTTYQIFIHFVVKFAVKEITACMTQNGCLFCFAIAPIYTQLNHIFYTFWIIWQNGWHLCNHFFFGWLLSQSAVYKHTKMKMKISKIFYSTHRQFKHRVASVKQTRPDHLTWEHRNVNTGKWGDQQRHSWTWWEIKIRNHISVKHKQGNGAKSKLS